jgi:thiol peroxidase
VVCVSTHLRLPLKLDGGAENIDKVQTLSWFRGPDFGKDYGVTMTDGPLAGLFARAVVVIGKDGKVTYTQLVSEIAQEPNYDQALAAVR